MVPLDNQIIKIQVNERQEQIVSARDLYQELGINKDFTSWFKYQVEKLSLQEGKDFSPILVSKKEGSGGYNKVDYIVRLDIAKHLCMISGGEMAWKLRDYFIEVEKNWNSPESVMARALQFSNLQMIKYEQKVIELATRLNMLTHSNKLYTTTEIAKELGLRSANELNKKLEKRKIQYKVNSTWVLTAKYSERGYVSIKQNVLDNGKVVYDRKWTESGRQFLLDLFQKKETA